MIKLNVCNFWPDFNYKVNFFTELFKSIYGEKISITDNPSDSDICIVTENYIPNNIDRKKTKIISFMGEPREVNYDFFDYYFNFDPTNFNLNSIRIPLWYIYINFFNLKDQKNPIPCVTPKTLKNNEWYSKQKNYFCVAPFSAVNLNRIKFYNLLNSYQSCTGFGAPFNNGDNERSEIKKYDFISNYRFCMTFENTLKTGYVTEKLLQAKTAGCIPIYWGSDYALEDFNKKCFIHVNSYESFDACLNHIKEINEDESLYKSYFDQPLFETDIEIKLEKIKTEIKKILPL